MDLLERAPVLDELDGVLATTMTGVGSPCWRARPASKASSCTASKLITWRLT
jgi:hypothetical protein